MARTGKVFITKYALTKGILTKKVEFSIEEPDMCIDKTGCYYIYYHKPEWHITLGEALAKAEDMRTKKIASLKKQISRLENKKW